ncbi:hypothetical protein SDC9_06554 [bioreactor metagenome]|uniref:Uncharacterized protein n=1 Tax=bioreactor metagenome TaxID=1076179 RepID=A0A644T257_9ZZZZ
MTKRAPSGALFSDRPAVAAQRGQDTFAAVVPPGIDRALLQEPVEIAAVVGRGPGREGRLDPVARHARRDVMKVDLREKQRGLFEEIALEGHRAVLAGDHRGPRQHLGRTALLHAQPRLPCGERRERRDLVVGIDLVRVQCGDDRPVGARQKRLEHRKRAHRLETAVVKQPPLQRHEDMATVGCVAPAGPEPVFPVPEEGLRLPGIDRLGGESGARHRPVPALRHRLDLPEGADIAAPAGQCAVMRRLFHVVKRIARPRRRGEAIGQRAFCKRHLPAGARHRRNHLAEEVVRASLDPLQRGGVKIEGQGFTRTHGPQATRAPRCGQGLQRGARALISGSANGG